MSGIRKEIYDCRTVESVARSYVLEKKKTGIYKRYPFKKRKQRDKKKGESARNKKTTTTKKKSNSSKDNNKAEALFAHPLDAFSPLSLSR